MIESSVLGTSPWNMDLWKDGNGSFLGFENLLDSADGLPLSSELTDETGLLDSQRSSSPSLSSSGPLEGDFNFWNELEDFIEKDTSATYGLDLDELSLDPTESSEVLSDWSSCGGGATFEDTDGHRSRHRLRRGLSPVPSDVLQASSSAKSWSSMSGEEQLRTVETLTEAISHQLGLREQLDVIRIIDPTACVDPAANREFIVDLRHLDDCKLRQIAEYVQRNADAAREQTGGEAEAAEEASSSRKKGRRRGSSRRSASEHSSPASSASKKVVPKRGRRKRHRQVQTATWHDRKAHRQMLKERRSGLFVHEQVLMLKGATATASAASSAASASQPGSSDIARLLEEEEDEEVDILH